MEVNYLAILACSVLALLLGSLWYGPLFGKKWMMVIGATNTDKAAREKMKKSAGTAYVVQFLLVLFQVWVLAFYIKGWEEASGMQNAFWIWSAFIMPTIAASAMWNNDSKKIAWNRFLIQSGYQLVLFLLFGWILGVWV